MNRTENTSSEGSFWSTADKYGLGKKDLKQIVVALLVVFTIRSSIIEPFKIPSGSMIPTLYIGDFIFVNKMKYRLQIPFTEWFGPAKTLIEFGKPQRGDVFVFIPPNETADRVHYIKRVIGIPGDVIEVREKKLFINGEAVPLTPVNEELKLKEFESINETAYRVRNAELFEEKLGEKAHFTMWLNHREDTRDYPPIKVPEGHVFAMGDNRDDSKDSRWWGFVPENEINGKAMFIWMSLWISQDPGASLFDLSATHISFHPERIGRGL